MKRENELKEVLLQKGLKLKPVLYNHFSGETLTYEQLIDEMNWNIDECNDDIETVEQYVEYAYHNGCFFEQNIEFEAFKDEMDPNCELSDFELAQMFNYNNL